MTIPDSALPLLAAAPSRFTGERSALAQTLAAKDAREAEVVRKLRRPLGLSWVMNRLARDHGAELDGLLAAADRLREGQRRAIAGRGADALRAAGEEVGGRSRALRERAAAVLEAEGLRADAAKLARLELLLRAAASSGADVRAALRRGALVREPEVSGELSGLALVPSEGGDRPPAAPPRVPATAQARRRGEDERRREEAPPRPEDARRRKEERRRVEEERRVRARARARAVARAEKEERAARAAEAEARRAAEVARRSAERAAALRARADRARADAEAERRE